MTADSNSEIIVRECLTVDELSACVQLQRDVFALPEIEISPVRHFIVTKNAGGFALGAFSSDRLVGFVLSVPAFLRGEHAFYSHMTAVARDFQSFGIGARLKWAQRERALAEGVKFIKWTFQPVQARNAYFNLEKLGAIVRHYEPNFYGTDYPAAHNDGGKLGLDSDRLFAEWHLESDKVNALSRGGSYVESDDFDGAIEIPANWDELVRTDLREAIAQQERIKTEFTSAFADGFFGRGFDRGNGAPRYLLFKS
ncbi:MAG: GNAT family N-acetyltransferase [Acidobacteria bacterium]|nr:GNAT family N-acetyltransferase [Acidobacteriota bacterium]MBK8150193.1 GNAT family N-acetyltransferase [Acidobacteriota bacterium]